MEAHPTRPLRYPLYPFRPFCPLYPLYILPDLYYLPRALKFLYLKTGPLLAGELSI
jgi:hypothetical protein